MYTLFLTPETLDLLVDKNSKKLHSWASCVQRRATVSISDLHRAVEVEKDVYTYAAKGYLL
jgi:hypothetical protein